MQPAHWEAVCIDPIKGKIRKFKKRKKKKGSIEFKLLWELERAPCSEELVLDEGWPAHLPVLLEEESCSSQQLWVGPDVGGVSCWLPGDAQPSPLAVGETNECKCLYLQLIYVNIYNAVINWASVAAYICCSRPLTRDRDLVVVITQRRLCLQNILLLLPLKGKVTKRWEHSVFERPLIPE